MVRASLLLLLLALAACRNSLDPAPREGEGDKGEGEGEGEGEEGEGEGEGCPGDPVPGLRVLVRDEFDFPVCDAAVEARVGVDFSEDLAAVGSGADCRYEGVEDRPGTYELFVEKTGYITFHTTGITVNAAGCHAQTKEVSLSLTPEP